MSILVDPFICGGSGLDPDIDFQVSFAVGHRGMALESTPVSSVHVAESASLDFGQMTMTEDRIKDFYKQTTNYIYELGEWHLFVPEKRESDLELVKNMSKRR